MNIGPILFCQAVHPSVKTVCSCSLFASILTIQVHRLWSQPNRFLFDSYQPEVIGHNDGPRVFPLLKLHACTVIYYQYVILSTTFWTAHARKTKEHLPFHTLPLSGLFWTQLTKCAEMELGAGEALNPARERSLPHSTEGGFRLRVTLVLSNIRFLTCIIFHRDLPSPSLEILRIRACRAFTLT